MELAHQLLSYGFQVYVHPGLLHLFKLLWRL